MCLAYLDDRPQQALLQIRGMHLLIGEPLYHEDGGLIADPLWPQWGQLCAELSTKLSLHQLVLSVSGTVPGFKTINTGNGGLQPRA
ncbi:hypothetical protein HO173_001403 [Letharia columbiana]|uniref:Uncharacterized protein n=1 Tax=Letharia columbiana TaxID=112416 RepID=A0A8H6L9R2_9LECA|nr:uncharacterized protein HO173_001403 [Letharia columbiana]KAF6240730.1 hypothetical protein HO173_001403 [Letharia columbiana]